MRYPWDNDTAHANGTPLRRLRNQQATKDRVLVVEDDIPLRTALSEHLEARGFEVTAVSDGISAIEALRHTEHDVVLLDLGIPRMSGRKFLHELRCDNDIAGIPIVLLTGSDERDVESAARHGVFAVHRKPSNARHVARSLRTAAYFA